MTDRELITLPREVAEHLTKMLEECPLIPNQDWSERDCAALTALRTALAAEQRKPEPVAWVQKWAIDRLTGQMGAVSDPVTWGIDAPLFTCEVHHSVPLYAAPPATHPGYVIGSHWLETAYSRICAGEAEADVLRDIGLVREEAFLTGVAHLKAENEALRRDAFRKGFYAGFAATAEGWNGEYPFQNKNRPIAGDPSVEAAIDAAMEDKR